MARKPTSPLGSWPSKPKSAAKSQPAPRNPVIEQGLCSAIRNGVLVELTYEDDFHSRAFAPYVVYRTSAGKVCVFGMQVNASHPNGRDDPRNFEVGKVRSVNLTTSKFERDPRFDLSSAKYRDRICPI